MKQNSGQIGRFGSTLRGMLREINVRVAERVLLALANAFTVSYPLPLCNAKVFFLRRCGMTIGTPCFVDSGFDFLYPANIIIGKNCSLGHHNRVWAFHRITLGDHVQTALGLTLIAGGHRTDDFGSLMEGQEIVLEGENWIGANVTILGGVTIGKGSIIGAGSVVTKSIPAGMIAAGVPARVIRRREVASEIISPFGIYVPSGY